MRFVKNSRNNHVAEKFKDLCAKCEIKIPKIFLNLPEKDAERIIMRELVVRLYQKGIISLGKAAEIIDLPITDFIELLSDEGIPINYDNESLAEDIRVVDRLVKKQKSNL